MAAQKSEDVLDLSLVIALDVSDSVSDKEYDLMRNGLANALDSADVANAIRSGAHGTIAVSIVHWSGFQEQDVRIGWSQVSSRKDLSRLAKQIREMRRRYLGGATDIGGLIDFAKTLIVAGPYASTRNVIDIAGDGTNNVNQSPKIDSDAAVTAGITINGLAVTNKTDTLAEYYSEFVIGGRDAFVENAVDYLSFERAMLRKLVREIQTLFT